MTIYICDGSYKDHNIGVGIVRKPKDGKTESYFFYKTLEKGDSFSSEIYAIEKTLELIKEQQDTDVLIYNDCKDLVNFISTGMKIKSGRKNYTKRSMERSTLQEKLENVSHCNISFDVIRHNHSLYGGFLQKAHHLSREYMKK